MYVNILHILRMELRCNNQYFDVFIIIIVLKIYTHHIVKSNDIIYGERFLNF